jgi:hypothetical protein
MFHFYFDIDTKRSLDKTDNSRREYLELLSMK